MSKHKMMATIPHGPNDLGAELECEITFTFTPGRPAVMYLRNGDPGYPADPDEIEFVCAAPFCNGKPTPFDGAYARFQQDTLNDLAEDWLWSDHGQAAAMEVVASDSDAEREYAAELRSALSDTTGEEGK